MNQKPSEAPFDDSGGRRRPGAREEPEFRNEDDNIPHEPEGTDGRNDRKIIRPEDQSDG